MTEWPEKDYEMARRVREDAHRLLDNGYEPIPLIGKVPAPRKWPSFEITHDVIDERYGEEFWSRVGAKEDCAAVREIEDFKKRYPTGRIFRRGVFQGDDGVWRVKRHATGLGIRVRGFCAIDADVNDPEMQQVIADTLRKHLGDVWWDEHLLRYGTGDKTMRICRIDDSFGLWSTAKLVRPGDDLSGSGATHRVEVFPGDLHHMKGTPTKQIGVLGQIKPATESTPRLLYRYDECGSVLDVRREDLPAIRRSDLIAALEQSERVMRSRGWVDPPAPEPPRPPTRGELLEKSRAKRRERDESGVVRGEGRERKVVRCLTPDMTLVGWGGAPIRVGELEYNDRVRMLEITGEGTNVMRGWCFVDADGPGVYDFETEVTYRLKEGIVWSPSEVYGRTMAELQQRRLTELSGVDLGDDLRSVMRAGGRGSASP